MPEPRKPRLIQVGPFVGVGERKAAEGLDRQLPGGWRIICNKELVDPDGSTREVDFIIVALVIIPMEEKELLQRFGEEYRVYMTQTPRFIPRLTKFNQLKQ